jgi:hypothetical protein
VTRQADQPIEFAAGGLDLDRMREGMGVIFAHPDWGYDADIKRAQEQGLRVGQVYRLARFVVQDWRTEFWLEGQGEVWFNSVQFEEAEA